jgi:serine/threonine protein kinase
MGKKAEIGLMLDRVITGRYRVDSQIGIGGMGIVYKAHDLKLRRDVALKVIAPHLVQDEEARSRFLREAQALAGLSHPNIITVFDLAEDPESESVFIVMELLNGRPLRKRITDPQRPPFFDMAVQVCRALECAHAKGILHRDIKPENIFVCDDGTLKLMDFGLARLVDGSNATQSGMVTGTVAYMSPEQLRGGTLDQRSDLYALGVLFYEYLCGHTPFLSDNPGTVLLKHLTETPPSLRAIVPTVSPELESLIFRLMEKDPAARYPSALIVRDALERMRAGGTDAVVASSPVSSDTATMSIPLVVPKQKTFRGSSIPRRIDRASRQVWRYVAVFCVLLLGIVLAFAFGETIQRMWLNSTDAPKKTDIAKKNPARPGKSSAGHKRSAYRTRRSSQRRKPAKEQNTAQETDSDTGAKPQDDTLSDSSISDQESSAPVSEPDTKNDTEPNG